MVENYLNTQKIIETVQLRIEAIEQTQAVFNKEREELLFLKEKLDAVINKIQI